MMPSDPPEWRFDPERPRREGPRLPLARLYTHAASLGADRPAVSDGTVALSFGALETGARRAAHRLLSLGAGPGRHVVVLSEKRAVMPLVAGAIWKTGAAYVPLDAQNPSERVAAQLAQLDTAAVVGRADMLARHASVLGDLPTLSFETVLADAASDGDEPDPPLPDIDEDATAYIIFTSGSTGVPKGVVISHRSLLDYFFNHNQVLRFGPSSRVFSLAPFHFDVSIEDTILPLSLGAYVRQYAGLAAGPAMRAVLQRERITHLIAVSSLLALMSGDGGAVSQEAFPDLSMVMTGAEVCDPRLIDLWVERLPRARVINAYGPTEATIVCLTYTIETPEPDRVASYPIGAPLPGVTVRVVDEAGRVVDGPGAQGELWIGGSQVMTGYAGRPEETAAACPVVDGERWLRTGDLVRIDDRGRIEYLQRLDEMVKIAGRRIDLGEIRARGQALPGVVRAGAGVVRHGERPIIALVLSVGDGILFDVADARAELARGLPDYMVPGIVRFTRETKLTGSGKTDERGLIARIQEEVSAAGPADGPL